MLEWVKNLGIPGVVFLIWYLYFRSQSKAWSDQQVTQSEVLMKLIEDHKDRDNKNFEVLNRYAETLEYHGACLARMEGKIDTNQFCPMMRKESGK